MMMVSAGCVETIVMDPGEEDLPVMVNCVLEAGFGKQTLYLQYVKGKSRSEYIPIENARGRDFAYELAIYDEFQDQSVSQADTLIKRLGADGKIIITGDIDQIHAPYIDPSSSGLAYASRQLMNSPMVAQVCFTEEEVIRHPLVKMITQRQKAEKGNVDTE